MSTKKLNTKNNMEKKYGKCVFCGKPILIDEYTTDSSLWAHSASPIAEDFCCGECNEKIVATYRAEHQVGSNLFDRNLKRIAKWMLEGKNLF